MNSYLCLMKERGLAWVINRGAYSLKLKLLKHFSFFEKVFEKKIPNVKRINLFTPNVKEIKKFLLSLPEDCKKNIISEADNVCIGKIKGFSSIDLDYGYPVQWHYNPLTKKTYNPKVKWYKISDFSPDSGDIKVVWEASRFSHFFVLARAYLITDEEKYYKAFSEQLSDWLEKNQYSYGVNFKCGQECAIRMMSCLIAYSVFSEVAAEEDCENIRELVKRCYKKILSNFFYAYRCQNNNHTLSELAGMIAGSWCCNDNRRMKYAYRILDKVINKQFFPDGGYIQQSFNYQRVALQDMEAVFCMGLKTGYTLSDVSKKKILNSVRQLYQCQDDSGKMPNYGLNDGSLIFPLNSCDYNDFTPCMNTVFTFLTGKKLYDGGWHEEELLWFGLDVNIQREIILKKSSEYPDSGIYTFRNKNFWAMVVAKKKINHMDQNHIDLWVDGENIFCDSGTYSYADCLGEKLSASESHNTLHFINKEQAYRFGPFAIYGQPVLKQVQWTPRSFYDEIIYKSGYVHKRRIDVGEDFIIIEDQSDTARTDSVEVIYHSPCNIEETEGGLKIGNKILFYTDAKISLGKSLRSTHYMSTDEINCISLCSADKRINTNIKLLRSEKTND